MSTETSLKPAKEWMDPFFRELTAARDRVLLLDYDGTLAPFRLERNEAVPYPGVLERLQRILDSKSTRMAFITGRRVKNLLPLLKLDPIPEIWGAHGWERRYPDGRIETQPMAEVDADASERLLARLKERGLVERCEKKPGSLTLHLRGLSRDNAAQVRDETLEEAPGLIAGSALEVRDFQGGVEFYLPGRDKGIAVDTILKECGNDCCSVFLGDDVTDEDAFRAMKGRGTSVLVASERRASAAHCWLKPPEELLEFLDRWSNPGGLT